MGESGGGGKVSPRDLIHTNHRIFFSMILKDSLYRNRFAVDKRNHQFSCILSCQRRRNRGPGDGVGELPSTAGFGKPL